MASVATLDRARIRELTEREERRLNERTSASAQMFERARQKNTNPWWTEWIEFYARTRRASR